MRQLLQVTYRPAQNRLNVPANPLPFSDVSSTGVRMVRRIFNWYRVVLQIPVVRILRPIPFKVVKEWFFIFITRVGMTQGKVYEIFTYKRRGSNSIF